MTLYYVIILLSNWFQNTGWVNRVKAFCVFVTALLVGEKNSLMFNSDEIRISMDESHTG